MGNDGWDKNIVALAGCAGFFLLFSLFYIFPRSREMARTNQSIESLRTARQEVAAVLPEVSGSALTTPLPQGEVQSWISGQCLAGMVKNLVANDGYLKGQGAKVKLRRLTPQQAAVFLSRLTRVRLEVERMELQDSDGDGRWDMEIQVKVPQVK